MPHNTQIDLELDRLRALGHPFAIATVVRTVAPTVAKPGDKAILDKNGTILAGFLGGGCVQHALQREGKAAMSSGAPNLLSIKPQELLDEHGVSAGEERDGVRYMRNGCPSKGSLDIFIEPVLPRPRLVILGSSAVAVALADLSERFEFDRALGLAAPTDTALPVVDYMADGIDDPQLWTNAPYIVIATQGQGDEIALHSALAHPSRYVGFVGSRRKFETLEQRLHDTGISRETSAIVHAPAGLDIQAITPEEIALSVLAQIIAIKRSDTRS